MKSIVVRLTLIIVALLTMLIAFVAVAQADSPPNHCGSLLPCEPVQCAAGTGDECKGPKLLVATPTPYPPCLYDPDNNGICDQILTPIEAPDYWRALPEANLQHRLFAPVERVIKALR